MLSVLIPTFNYNTLNLVQNIYKQCIEVTILFEIFVQDDGTTNEEIIKINEQINTFHNCFYEINKTNLGRASNLNTLIQKANFEWVLILDCDVLPINNQFIFDYKNQFKQTNKVVFGGLAYKNKIDNPLGKLRWKYGIKREALTVKERNKNKYETILTSNTLFHISVFEKIKFNNTIKKYGYEDFVFAMELKNNNILVKHIENRVYHLNLETATIFIQKTKNSLETLHFLESNKIVINKTKLQKMKFFIERSKLKPIFNAIYKLFDSKINKNLHSKNPSIFLFDVFKLNYYLNLK